MFIFVTGKWRKWIKRSKQSDESRIYQPYEYKNFFKLINLHVIMKHFIKGMTLLLAGISFMACSKDVAFDENAQKEAKAQAEIAQKFATYESDFVKAFGSVAANHKWGFDQTTGFTTRAAVVSSTDYWIIPENCWGPSQNKEGWNASDIRQKFIDKGKEGGILSELTDFSFDNYFLQHVKKVQGKQGGKIKKSIDILEAYDSKNKKWQPVTNFKAGDNPNGTFTTTAEDTYYYQPTHKSVKGTTLMEDMGGAADNATGASNGKLFRLKNTDGTYNYDYGFIRTTAYHKDLKKDIENEPFLVFQLPGKDEGNYLYWVIRLGVAEKATEPDPVVAEGRVLCEDMGANDFDFNDVVFDATIYNTGEIKIKVLAHGGILPIAIDGQLVTLGNMTNTGVNKADIQEFTIAAVDGQPKYASIDAIPVVVNPNGEAGNTWVLDAPLNSAPQKVCVPVGTDWPDEYVIISKAYTPFNQWVNTTMPSEWSKTVVSRYTDLDLSNNADDWTEPVEGD